MIQHQGKPCSELAHLDTREPSYKGPGNSVSSLLLLIQLRSSCSCHLPFLSLLLFLYSQIFDVSPLLPNPQAFLFSFFPLFVALALLHFFPMIVLLCSALSRQQISKWEQDAMNHTSTFHLNCIAKVGKRRCHIQVARGEPNVQRKHQG